MTVIKRFAADRSGNFAIFGALALVPLVLGAGVALDVATISRTKTELQQALDAAVLAVAREGKEISDKSGSRDRQELRRDQLPPAVCRSHCRA
jgi:Flp pilus assembly protein TadG